MRVYNLVTLSVDAPLWSAFGKLVKAERTTKSGLIRQLIMRELRAAETDGRLPAKSK